MKKRTIYIGLSLIFIIGIVSLIGTFAVDTTITEGNSSKADYLFNIVLGDRTNRQIVIPSYDSKIVDVKVSNPNTFNMSYLLYLEGTNSNISVVNIGDMDANGVVKSKDVGTVRIFIQNNGSSNITVSLKDLVGFESETLSLPSNSTSINKSAYYKVVVKPNNTSYGKIKPNIKLSATNGTVKYQIVPNDGYTYKSNTCGGTVSNNVLTISSITSNISCQVVFEVKTVAVSLDMTGGVIETFYNEVKQYTYTVPYTGSYKLETWGASGGAVTYSGNTYRGGFGGYSTGNVSLTKGSTLYINIGGAGTGGVANQNYNGGYNGGGSTNGTSGTDHYHSSGGGATHIATKSGLLSSLSSNLSSILIVSGGGGGGYIHTAGTGYGSLGGSGGGYLGTDATTSGSNGSQGLGGSQTAGGKYSTATATSDTSYGSFGQGGKPSASWGSAGGGGYYGGGASRGQTMANGNSGGGGGAGYIGNSLLTDKYMYCYNCSTSTATATKTYTTTNVSASAVSDYAKNGNGAAKISYLDIINYTVSYTAGYGVLPTPTRNGYTFDGWYTEPDGKGTLVTNGSGLASDTNHTLYAKWKKGCNLPTFSYTGNYQIVDDNNNTIENITTYTGNWKIRFLTSGTLTISDLGCASDGIDAFVVGGGGNGASGTRYTGNSVGGGGGGGGSAITVKRIAISTGTSYSIVVGAATENSSFGVGSTAYFTALAGSTAPAATFSNTTGFSATAGVGGAGRLSTETNNYGAIGVTVKNGSDGNGIDGNYEFNEEGNKRYGAGGGFGTQGVSTGSGGTAALGKDGGADGGGKGGQGCSFDQRNGKYATYGAYAGSSGTANTGSGGGGGGGACGSGTSTNGSIGGAGAGGTGIVIIRNTRTNESNPPVGTLTATKSYNTINASISATDDTGIDHYEYYLSASSTCPTTGYTTSNSNTHSFEVTNTGTYYVCARVVDLLGNALSLKSNAFTVSRVYKVAIRYNTNGGTITSSAGGYTWTTDSTGLIYRNGSIYEQTLYYGKTIDLANYNNSSFINISIGDAYVVSGSEWVCLSGCSNVGKIYNQDVKYSTSDFCDLTSSNCTVVLGLRIVEDITPPTCTISANSTTITAVPADDKGVAKLSYYGWDSNFSGSNSTTKAISAGTHTYYVKDGSGNTASCSITIANAQDGCNSGYVLNSDGNQCYRSVGASPVYKSGGSCYCKSSTSGLASNGGCSVSGGVAVCSCPTGAYVTENNCTKTIITYNCSEGEQIGYSCYFYDDVIRVCPSSDYTKIDSNYCYK